MVIKEKEQYFRTCAFLRLMFFYSLFALPPAGVGLQVTRYRIQSYPRDTWFAF